MSAAVDKYHQPITRLSAALMGACAVLALSGCLGDSSDPPPQTYSLSATVSGLDSSGLLLSVNGWALRVAANTTSQVLAGVLPSGAGYAVAITQQPADETCTTAQGQGVIHAANVANVVITCSDQAYPLGGTISGLNGSGLVLANGSDTRAVSAGASTFTMPTPVAYTSGYSVTVQTQPAGEACAVGSGTGTMPLGGVSTVAVSCTDQPFSLGGSISGLASNSGLVLTNGSDRLTVAAGSTSFTMPQPVAFGSSYSVAVQSAPPGLTCSPSHASGSMPASNVTTVLIACSDQSYNVGGTVSGLISGGLVLANGSDTLAVSSGATAFTMPTAVAYTSPYTVVVHTQPAGLFCSVSSGSGTMGAGNVTNVAVTCSANHYSVGGTISGLTASGLVLLDNGGDATTLSANATQFTMNSPVAYDSAYAITVQSQPTTLVCSVTHGSGTMGAADVTSVSIACVSNTTDLYSFTGGAGGYRPSGGLIQASDGNFYGTTTGPVYSAGIGYGTIFTLTPSGTETLLYSFTGGSDGAIAYFGGLIQARDGNLYGTTNQGGASGYGTVFRLTPSGTETILYSFMGGSDGAYPYGTLLQTSDGNFYGTTQGGDGGDYGTIFKITPSGTETVLYAFTGGSDGAYPTDGMILGSDGNLYGTTTGGGASGNGVVFNVTLSGTETVLYAFTGGTDGGSPYAGVMQASDGNFYGASPYGGASGNGVVYKVTPSGTETVLYSFMGGSDGDSPYACVIQASDGNFYGTTGGGDYATDYGTIYKLTPSGTETVLHSFTGTDGAFPSSGLLQASDGNFYGTTADGGANNFGVVFQFRLQ